MHSDSHCRPRLFSAALLFVLLFCMGIAPLHAFGQSATASASISGIITDKTGAVVTGAQITMTEGSTGTVRSVTTGQSGLYRFDLLPPGRYTLKITKEGFAVASSELLEVMVGQNATFNAALQAGSTEQSITVSTDSPILDTTKTGVSMNITPREVQSLPLNGRDFGNLATLAPGARPVNSYDPTKQRVAVFSVNGSDGRNVNVTVDGVDNKDNGVGGPVMQLALNAVQEFVISTQRFSAANGRSEGAAINVITKNGTNRFHGGLQYYDSETALNANDYFSQKNNAPTPQFSRQQFGGDIGGPIRTNRDFFFFALARQREHTAIPVSGQAYQELSRLTAYGAQPVTSIPTPYSDWRYTARVDHTFNDANNAYITFNRQTNIGDNDQANNNNDLTAGNYTKNSLILAGFALNSIINPRVVNSFTLGYQYWNDLIQTDKPTPLRVNFPNSIAFGTSGNVPQGSDQKKWQFRDDISIAKGAHTFKVGVDYVWEPLLGGFFGSGYIPSITFSDLPSVIQGNTNGLYPQGFATPGAATSMSVSTGDHSFDLLGGAKMFGTYFEDDWKESKRLTLNLGVRWDKDFNTYNTAQEAQNRTYLALKTINSPYANKLPKDDNRGLSPRVGFSYDLTGSGRHLLMGGYGLYFGQSFLNEPLFAIQQSHPTLYLNVYSVSLQTVGAACTNCNVPGTSIPLSQWRYGIDPTPVRPNSQTQLPANSVGRLIDPDYRNPYTEQQNIGYQWGVSANDVIEVQYVHNLGLHEGKSLNLNPLINGTRLLASAFSAAGIPQLAQIVNATSQGRSRYDGLSVAYRRRMAHHFSINSNYTLSRGVGWGGNAAGFGNSPVDPTNPWAKTEFGPVPNDERHRVVLSGIFELPFGLEVAPIMQAASARAYTTSMGTDVFGFGSGNTQPHAIVYDNDPKNYTALATASASTIKACLAAGSCHQIGYNALRGQPFFQWDTRVSKNIKLGHTSNLKLLFQAFDLTNRANFGNNYGTSVRTTTFGQPTGYITPGGVTIPKALRAEFGADFSF